MFVEGELADIYKTNFLLAKEHNISLSEIDDMMPFERKITIAIALEYLAKKAQLIRETQNATTSY